LTKFNALLLQTPQDIIPLEIFFFLTCDFVVDDFAIDTEKLEKQIAVCSDKEVLELAEIKMPPEQDNRLRLLLNKQNESALGDEEQRELWQLMEAARLATLKKAYDLREKTRRGLDGKN
jgi:hypothetical protein